MQRVFFFIYGLFCHALFLVVYAWMAAFLGNFGFNFISTIDSPRQVPLSRAILIDLALIALFGLQHSIMARPAFKSWWRRFIPQPIERSTFVLASCICMIALLLLWQPIGFILWDASNPALRIALHALFALGLAFVPLTSILINHFDLFGTRQVWLHLRGKAYTNLPFRTPFLYRFVRHPLYVSFIIAFWATPTMSIAHFVFALGMTAYIFIAVPLEERDLVAHFGETYESYRRNVGGYLPRLRAKSPAPAPHTNPA